MAWCHHSSKLTQGPALIFPKAITGKINIPTKKQNNAHIANRMAPAKKLLIPMFLPHQTNESMHVTNATILKQAWIL